MTRKCPVCDSPHDDWISLKRHMWKKQDSEHEHTDSPAAAEKWLVQNGHKDTNGSSSSAGSSTSEESPNPVFGDADPDAGEKDTGGTDAVGLPCGCESYEPSEAPDPPFRVTCTQCGEVYRVSQ